MLDKLRDQIASYLMLHDVCIVSAVSAQGAWAMPVRYHSHGLKVDLVAPRWADVIWYVEQDPNVFLVIESHRAAGLCWLQYQGIAQPVAAPNWTELLPGWKSMTAPDDLYQVIRVTPKRIELVDENRGWGARETLEL
ncbi:MAG: hypothetical protein HY741_06560 [Chloroflexi bacterium]|nr:hypothetical protein [Chloroflexota bacterium]